MKYADLFAKEAGAHVAAIRSLLETIGTSPDDARSSEFLKQLRNESHGLVGVAAAVELGDICRLMSAVEHCCVTLTRAGAAPTDLLLDAFRQAVDAVDALGRAALDDRDPPDLDVDSLVAAVSAGASQR